MLWTMINYDKKLGKELIAVIYSKLDILTRISSHHLLPRSVRHFTIRTRQQKRKKGGKKRKRCRNLSLTLLLSAFDCLHVVYYVLDLSCQTLIVILNVLED